MRDLKSANLEINGIAKNYLTELICLVQKKPKASKKLSCHQKKTLVHTRAFSKSVIYTTQVSGIQKRSDQSYLKSDQLLGLNHHFPERTCQKHDLERSPPAALER